MSNKMPVLLTFDLDGETLWRCRDPENANRPVVLSQGRYGPECGAPRILNLLKKYDIKATFFVPGFTIDQYPDLIKQIDAEGHEIGNHGWSHTYPDNMDGYDTEKKEYVDSSDLLEKLIGKRPKGYRSPAWEFSPNTIEILESMGDFEYSSNMMDSDKIKYLKVNGIESSLVEIPVSWTLDDAAFWLYSLRTPGKCIQSLESVQQYWTEEFDALSDEFIYEATETGSSDISYVLTCHPQIVGRPSRMRVLENVIRHIADTEIAEFKTGLSAARDFKTRKTL
ncbi:hypothetical protein AGMMS49983_08070 [Clostridia bacterium]|nr:hypothetical protein AGMMS49983_08070 [Clostridia bacterium]